MGAALESVLLPHTGWRARIVARVWATEAGAQGVKGVWVAMGPVHVAQLSCGGQVWLRFLATLWSLLLQMLPWLQHPAARVAGA